MKKLIIFALAFMIILIAPFCTKNSTSANTSLEGKWTGNYHGGPGTPVNFYSLTFNAGGSLVVQSDNSATPNIANGTWTLAGDSVRATYTYASTAVTFSLAGRYSASSNTMNGTIGNGFSTSGIFTFTVVKE